MSAYTRGAKVIIRRSLTVIFFVMKNFGSAYEISLLNRLEFIPSSRENDIGQVDAARVNDHTSSF